jgi:transcription antitermination factor NusG
LWYVAHTKARNEKALAQDLSRWGIPCYLPLANRQTKSRRTGRISRSQVPVFPGYVFFAATEEQRYQSLTTNRIAKLLIVPEQQQLMAELQRIQHLLAADEAFSTVERLEAGDWGRITAGPLTGLEGIVLPSGGRWRLSMSVTILGQSVQVEVDREHVERIDPPTWSTQPAARSAGF